MPRAPWNKNNDTAISEAASFSKTVITTGKFNTKLAGGKVHKAMKKTENRKHNFLQCNSSEKVRRRQAFAVEAAALFPSLRVKDK